MGSFGVAIVFIAYIMTQKKNIPKFEEIFSTENLLRSFYAFRSGKKSRTDVAEFSMRLIENITTLHNDIMSGAYRHGGYEHFKISDPKSRDIHKASVRDRVVHHAIYGALYPYFDQKFVCDSYSCRVEKGVHKAIYRFESCAKKSGLNHTRTVWVLKGDVKKCFASVDHDVLRMIISKDVLCQRTTAVLDEVINSFSSWEQGKGLPLGNLTSQIFINIYLNEFDQYVKRELKVKHFIRYADDFVIFSHDKEALVDLVVPIERFLAEHLQFTLHPDKLFLKTVASGVDFLGWVHFFGHRVLRTTTKKRMFLNINKNATPPVLASYCGLLRHGNAQKLRDILSSKIEKMPIKC